MKIILTSIVCIAAIACRGAAVYHVDAIGGDDSNDGLTEATAWKSLKRVNTADVKPGDSVLFKRGCVWRGTVNLKNGAPGARTYYGAYGEGPKPILQGSTERNRESDWFEISPGLWSTSTNKGTIGECLYPAAELRQWGVHFEKGFRCTSKASGKEDDWSFVISCTNTGPEASSNRVQIWGPRVEMPGSSIVFKFKVRGKPVPRTMSITVPHPPWAKIAVAPIRVAEKAGAGGWRDASVCFTDCATSNEKKSIHLSLGDIISAGDRLEIKPEGIYSFTPDERSCIGRDVGILLLGGEEAWGVKKWALKDLRDDLDYWYDAGNDRVVLKLDRNPAKAYPSIELCKTWTIMSHANRHDVTVEALTLRYSGGFAFSGGGATRFTVRNCDIYFIGGGLQCWRKLPGGGQKPVRYGNGIEYWSPARDCLVERCRFWQIYDAAVTPQQSGSANGFDNITYRDNVFWQCEYSFEFWNHAPSSHTANVMFEHNTSVDAGMCWSHAQRPDPNGAHLMCYLHTGAMTNQVIRNNVFCHASDWGFRFCSNWRDALEMDYNLHCEPLKVLSWCRPSSEQSKRGVGGWRFGAGPAEFRRYQEATGLDAHSLYATPRFVNPELRDYRLVPGSPGSSLASDGGPVGARDMPGIDKDQSIGHTLGR